MTATRKLAWAGSLCLLLIALWIASESSQRAGVTDFAAYWTASRQLLAGRNPYAMAPVLAMEQRLGFTEAMPLVMRNPPWALPLVLPLGLLPYSTAQRLWLWAGLAAVLLSNHLLWRSYANPKQPFWVGWLVAGMFLPVSAVLALGQMGPLILLGVAGFLVCQQKRRDGAAGAFALLIALKPHLVFLFWAALFLWALQERRWRVLWGFGVTLCACIAISLALDPKVFAQYRELWTQLGVLREVTPTPGGALCVWFGGQRRWLAFTPAVAAAIWFSVYWIRHRRDWRWWEQMPLLLLVSLAATPYAWLFDQVILLPAVLQTTARVTASGPRWLWPALIYLGVSGFTLGLILGHRTMFWYAWTAPAWLLMYLWVDSRFAKPVLPE